MTITVKFCFWTTLEYFLLVVVLHVSHCHMEASWGLPGRQRNFGVNSLLSAFNLLLFSYGLRWQNIFKRGPSGFSLPTSFQASCFLWGTAMWCKSVICHRDAGPCCMFSIQGYCWNSLWTAQGPSEPGSSSISGWKITHFSSLGPWDHWIQVFHLQKKYRKGRLCQHHRCQHILQS